MGKKDIDKKIDYSKIGKIIDFVTIKLNNYMIDCPNVLLDPNKQTNLLDADNNSIANTYKVELGIYYAGMLVWYSSNNEAANGIIAWCNENTPLMPKEMAKELMAKDPKKKVDFLNSTKILMDLGVTNYQRKIAATKNVSVFEIPKAAAGEMLNVHFNQKMSDYNTTLVVESFNKILKITKGEE